MTGYFDHDLPITFDRSADSNGYVLTFCGQRTGGQDGHPGYDWSMPIGTPLLAVADGVVLLAGEGPEQFCSALNRVTTGLLVLLEHVAPSGEKFVSLHGHVSEVLVTTGERVSAGQRVARSGNTGCSLGPHLHFEVGRVLGARRVQIDPYGWKGARADPWETDARGAASVWLWSPGEAPSLAP
jgi:murein DD-endopeptidase MepM/ murein hydrolase activator NlpD